MASPLPECVRKPAFLERNGRRLYTISFSPDVAEASPAVILFAQFAEEMNRCRRMMTLQTEALAKTGVTAVIFDYSCTGDSSGCFAQASWNDWIEDGVAVMEYVRDLGTPKSRLLGIRLGAALALEAARRSDIPVDRIALWQPVASGSVHLTQFLRLRIAAALTGEPDGETTRSLRERLSAGETLEIGGYSLSGSLAESIADATLDVSAPDTPVCWLECVSQTPGSLLPASDRVIDAWRNGGSNVESAIVPGAPFWSVQETTVAPALLEKTTEILAGA